MEISKEEFELRVCRGVLQSLLASINFKDGQAVGEMLEVLIEESAKMLASLGTREDAKKALASISEKIETCKIPLMSLVEVGSVTPMPGNNTIN